MWLKSQIISRKSIFRDHDLTLRLLPYFNLRQLHTGSFKYTQFSLGFCISISIIIQQLLPQHVTLIILNTVKLKQRYEENEKLLKITPVNDTICKWKIDEALKLLHTFFVAYSQV